MKLLIKNLSICAFSSVGKNPITFQKQSLDKNMNNIFVSTIRQNLWLIILLIILKKSSLSSTPQNKNNQFINDSKLINSKSSYFISRNYLDLIIPISLIFLKIYHNLNKFIGNTQESLQHRKSKSESKQRSQSSDAPSYVSPYFIFP